MIILGKQIIDGVSHVDSKQLARILDEEEAIYVIDVREEEEYIEGHIPGIPLIPMSEIPELVDQFDKKAEYILVCRSGRRSLEVAKFFQNEGIEKVHNHLGGMLEWTGDVATGLEHVIKEFSMKNIGRKR